VCARSEEVIGLVEEAMTEPGTNQYAYCNK